MSQPITKEHLKRFIPYDALPEAQLDEIVERAKRLVLPAGKLLFKRGDAATHCVYLLSGAVDMTDYRFNITRVRAGDEKSRDALDNRHPHEHSMITKEPSEFLLVDRDELDLVVTWGEAGDYVVTDLEESSDDSVDWMQGLLRSPLMRQVPPSNIQKLFGAFTKLMVAAGDVVIREGESGDRFYVIAEGQARVSRTVDGVETEVVTLGPGDFFGEDALIGEAPRNATVVMRSGGRLMVLEKDLFRRLLVQEVLQRLHFGELDGHRAKGPVALLDVRMPGEFAAGSVPGAVNVPLRELRRYQAGLDRSALYVMLCDGGRRSEVGAYMMKTAGFKAVVLAL